MKGRLEWRPDVTQCRRDRRPRHPYKHLDSRQFCAVESRQHDLQDTGVSGIYSPLLRQSLVSEERSPGHGKIENIKISCLVDRKVTNY